MSSRARAFSRAAIVAAAVVLVGGPGSVANPGVDEAVAASKPRSAAKPFDFNGDGYADLAAGAPDRTVSGKDDAGAVYVMYGSSAGLRASLSQYLDQTSPGIRGRARDWDFFGAATTSADFDTDGYADLALSSGVYVHIVFGGRSGLTARSIRIRLETYGLPWPDLAPPLLATGDFDADGRADLVVASTGGEEGRGVVAAFRGTRSGIDTRAPVVLRRNAPDIPGEEFPDDGFGAAIAAGDVTGDGYDDLAITSGEEETYGSLYLFRGSASGLQRGTSTVISDGDVVDLPARLGISRALAIDDLDGDGLAEVIMGAPELCFDADEKRCGAVVIFAGSAAGLDARRRQILAPGVGGIPARLAAAGFGTGVAVGDLNRDGRPDLVVNAPWTKVRGKKGAGAVVVFPGSPSGVTGDGAREWSQGTRGVKGTVREADAFGWARYGPGVMRVLDFGKGRGMDLAIHSVEDRLPGSTEDHPRMGTINVLYGAGRGLSAKGDQLWHANKVGLVGRTREGGRFGGGCC